MADAAGGEENLQLSGRTEKEVSMRERTRRSMGNPAAEIQRQALRQLFGRCIESRRFVPGRQENTAEERERELLAFADIDDYVEQA